VPVAVVSADAGVIIRLATPDDIGGILALQNANLPDQGGTLSAAFSADWFAATIADMPVIVAVRDGGIVGFLVSAKFSAHADVPIVQAMLRVYAGTVHSYLYGPVCVTASERGSGLAGRMFAALRQRLPGREGILFIRRDNAASLWAHAKMGMAEVAAFEHAGTAHAVLSHMG
jgi:L-amino acid N-acyltransferase YncA